MQTDIYHVNSLFLWNPGRNTRLALYVLVLSIYIRRNCSKGFDTYASRNYEKSDMPSPGFEPMRQLTYW